MGGGGQRSVGRCQAQTVPSSAAPRALHLRREHLAGGGRGGAGPSYGYYGSGEDGNRALYVTVFVLPLFFFFLGFIVYFLSFSFLCKFIVCLYFVFLRLFLSAQSCILFSFVLCDS